MTSLSLRGALLACIAEGRGTTPPPASGLPTTMTLVNTSGSTQASGFITPIFGMTFRQGDIPSGDAPTFTVSGTPQPYSWGLQSYWPDGSLLHASFMFRCTSSIAGSGSLTVDINSGGSAPSASARTLTEVYAQDLKTGGTGLGSFGGLTGTWNGYVRSDSNNTEQYVYLDGDAGKVWRIRTDMAQTAGGSPHGQLLVYHFVHALTDGSGNLGGFRYIARVNQPIYNSGSTPAQRAFASISTQYGAGPTSIPTPWPFTNINFTTAAAGVDCTVASAGTHNLYCGAQSGSGGSYVNAVPGYLSATTDANLSTSQIYYAYTYGLADNNTVFRLCTNPNGFSTQITMAGGTSTFVPIPVCLFAGSVFTADAQAKVNFFQGTGSMSTDGTVRTQFNREYLHSTGAIPPWNLSVSGTAFGGTIKDIPDIVGASSTSYWSGTPTWNPVSVGPLSPAARGVSGNSPDIGPLTTWHCTHFYNQSAVSDFAVRAITFASDFDGAGLRDAATGNYLNFSNSSYTGMPAPSSNQQNTVMAISSSCYGFTAPSTPSASTGYLMGGQQDSQHRPCEALYGFVVFGEPHFYDLMIEYAQAAFLQISGASRVPTSPAGYGILFTSTQQGLRGSAWCFRDLLGAATFSALISPDGSDIPTYLKDLVSANLTYINTLYSSTYIGSTLNGQNSWRKVAVDNSFVDISSGGFMMGYHENIMAWAQALGWSGAATWNNNYSTWLNYVISNFGAYHLYAEYDGATLLNTVDYGPAISSFTQYGITSGVYGSLTWTSGGSRHFNADAPILGYVVTAGDQWVFHDDQGKPGNFSYSTGYYAVNVSGNAFDLAASPGGSPITPSNSGTIVAASGPYYLDASSPFLLLAAPPLASSGLIPSSSTGQNDSYLLYRQMAWNWAVAAGATGYSTALAESVTRLNVYFPDFTSNANWYGQDTL